MELDTTELYSNMAVLIDDMFDTISEEELFNTPNQVEMCLNCWYGTRLFINRRHLGTCCLLGITAFYVFHKVFTIYWISNFIIHMPLGRGYLVDLPLGLMLFSWIFCIMQWIGARS